MAVDGSELELRELTDGDVAEVTLLTRRSFGFPATERPDPDHLPTGQTNHGAFLGGRLVGQAFDLHDQQWWGGRLLGSADLAGVAVAPEARGRGVARALVGRFLEHARDRGAVVSALFPSISTVYRTFGWARAGSVDVVEMPASALPSWQLPPHLVVQEARPEDIPGVHELYRRVARARNGMLSRDEVRFEVADDELPSGVDGITVVLADGEVAGYCTWARGSGYSRANASVTTFDLLAATPNAARALVTVLGSWRTVVPVVRLRLLRGDGITDCVPLELGTIHSTRSWMHRPVDVEAAVAARGWPVGARGRAVFSIEDRLAPWNTGTWALDVTDGGALLRRTQEDTSVHLTVNGFAALYCGLANIAVLRESGHVSGPYDDAAALDVLGTSAPPRLLDTF
jgi:predicted acetyltransferase